MEQTVNIYLDRFRIPGTEYVEDTFSSASIIEMDKETFAQYIKQTGNIHSCYSPFINHIGRFRRQYGEMWAGCKIRIFRTYNLNKDGYIETIFNEKGQLTNWPIGFFG